MSNVPTGDLLHSLVSADVLGSFLGLPEDARRRFEEWVDKASDTEAHWRRIDTLVIAMRCAPGLAPAIPEPVPEARQR